MKTHRCEQSLKHKVSIRYSKECSDWNFINDDYETWRLFKSEICSSSFNYILNHVSIIEYCPFCGKKL